MEEKRIEPAKGPLVGTVRVPASKSLTHRGLLLAALAEGVSRVENPLIADDTMRMARALAAFGARLEPAGPGREAILSALGPGGRATSPGMLSGPAGEGSAIEVTGLAGRPRAPLTALDLGGAGTALRLLTAVAALAPGEVVLDGDKRLRERPMAPLIDALVSLGVEARCVHADGFAPVIVRGPTLRGGRAHLRGDQSSQFASALMIVAPLAGEPVTVDILPPVVSLPYLHLTLKAMGFFHEVPAMKRGQDGSMHVSFSERGRYRAAVFQVPPDASSASYLLAAAAVTGGRVQVEGLHADDVQPDTAFLGYLGAMGCTVESDPGGVIVAGSSGAAGGGRGLRAFDLALGATPDLVPTLAVLALFADGPSEIREVSHLRLKESDRLAALAKGLSRLGALVEEHRDGLRITPGPLRGARIETFRDHRIAMAFAVAGLAIPGVTIEDPACVGKSFPGFWSALDGLSPS